MDPDLVRQQAEEEAASRMLARRTLTPDTRIEPVLPMGSLLRETREAPQPAPSTYRAGVEAAAAVISAGWRTAVGIAASCVLASTVGLVGGVMLGVKLQLVPSQGAAAGAAAGFLIGWQVTSTALVRQATMPRWRALGVGFRASLVSLTVMAGAVFVAPHYLGAPGAPTVPFEMGVFWKSVAAGAMIAIVLAGVVVRGALDRGAQRP